MSDYVPKCKQVRMEYAYLGGTATEAQYDRRAENFDRWLAAIQAAAFDRGVDAAASSNLDERLAKAANPYRNTP